MIKNKIVLPIVFIMVVASLGCKEITGTISQDGAGIPDVKITLSGDANFSTTTDQNGYYSFTQLEDGIYQVVPANGCAFLPAVQKITINGKSVNGIDFQIQKCRIWQGDVHITNSEDLDRLEGYTGVDGEMEIVSSDLTDLRGLESLVHVSGSLALYDNDFLSSLEGLNNLASIDEVLLIGDNPFIHNLSGLENLSRLGILWSVSDTLVSFEGLTNVISLDSATITGNENLNNFKGLNNLLVIYDSLTVMYSYGLKSLEGLDQLKSVGGDLQISENNSLTELGLGKLAHVGDYFEVFSNAVLCDSAGEALRDQVLAAEGIGGEDIHIASNGWSNDECWR